jgi:hypothetical protein
MEEFGNGSMWLVWASNGLSWIVNVGLQVALLVVVLTAVRRHRRDAMGWMLAAAGTGLATSIVGPVTGWAGTLLGSRVGVDTMLLVQAGLGLFGTILHALVFLFLLRGIVGLARPAQSA